MHFSYVGLLPVGKAGVGFGGRWPWSASRSPAWPADSGPTQLRRPERCAGLPAAARGAWRNPANPSWSVGCIELVDTRRQPVEGGGVLSEKVFTAIDHLLQFP